MTRAEYDQIDAINYSSLKHMSRSPLHYRSALMTGGALTGDAVIFGRVVHYATFEPEKLETHVALWDGRRAGTEWEAFAEANAQREIIKPQPYERALAVSRAARAAAGKLLSEGESECVLQWTDAATGLRCKGVVDHISRGFGIIDLKSTNNASPLIFGARAAGLSYHAQGAMYTDGAELSGYKRLPYTILAVETKAPYAAALYTLGEDTLALGQESYRGWLRRVVECREAGEWPGYAPQELHMPKWAVPDEDDGDDAGLVWE